MELALVIVTAVYATIVFFQLREMRRQRSDDNTRWTQRIEEERAAQRATISKGAAREALDAILSSGIRPGADRLVVRTAAPDLKRALDKLAPLIDVAGVPNAHEIAERVWTTSAFIFRAGFNDQGLNSDGISREMVTIHTRKVVEECAWSLQDYIGEHAIRPWTWPTSTKVPWWLSVQQGG